MKLENNEKFIRDFRIKIGEAIKNIRKKRLQPR